MKGTEKQITWAQDIIRNIITALTEEIEETKATESKSEAGNKRRLARIEKMESFKAEVEAFDGDAGKVIDHLKWFNSEELKMFGRSVYISVSESWKRAEF